MSSIKTRIINSNEIEFDFIHPIDNKRIRRKLAISAPDAEKVCALLEYIMDNSLTASEAKELIMRDPLYRADPFEMQFLSYCETLYFNYEKKHIEQISEFEQKIDSIFTKNNETKICLLGRAGVGKSSIIRKMSFFSDTDINFPFIDTSRTTTFAAEYHFTKEKSKYNFAIKFIGSNVLYQYIYDCSERAVIKGLKKQLPFQESDRDDIISAFYDDPSNVFDIRLILGKHIKSTSKNKDLEKNRISIEYWNSIADKCIEIASLLNSKNVIGNMSDDDFYAEKLSSLIKSTQSNSVKEKFEQLIDFVNDIVEKQKRLLIELIERERLAQNIEYSTNGSFFVCTVVDLKDDKFKDFISIFTSRHISSYGKSVLPLVEKLWFDLPYNSKIDDEIVACDVCCYDTIGIAHNNDNAGSFDGSTKLEFDNVDGIIIVDDSRVNMDNNTGVILKHISSRVSPQKIYFALTFYDEFSRQDFDPDEDQDEQKQQYLSKIQEDKILEYLENNNFAKELNKRTEKSTYYLKFLSNKQITNDGYDGLSKLINRIRLDSSMRKSSKKVAKIRPNAPFVSFNYSLLPLIYLNARDKFISQQSNIYLSSMPPHFKTTEALTRRLSSKVPSFSGSRNLTPVDDLYNNFIQELSGYITNPNEINIVGESNVDVQNCLEDFKSFVTDQISNLVEKNFFSEELLKEWTKLYSDYGTGVDYRRRTGLIMAENRLVPDKNNLLNGSYAPLYYDLERTITLCVEKFEERLK